MTVDKETLRAMIKDAVGEEKAAIAVEATKLIETLEKKFGSLDAARASGAQTNFFAHENREQKSAPVYDAGRFLRTLASARGSMEGAKAIAKQNGDKRMVEMIERTMDNRAKAMTYSDFTAGGALVPEEFSNEVIGLLYSQLAVTELGADVVPMPNGNLTLPYLDTGVTASYVGEIAVIQPSQQTTGQIQLTAKKLAAVVPISNDLLRTPSSKADRFVQNDLLRRLKVRAEQAFLRGTGANGEPKGVRNWTIAGNVATQTGTTLADKIGDLGKLQRLVQEQDVPLDMPGYIMSPRTEWGLKNTVDGLGNFVFLKMMEAGVLLGVPYKASTLVQNTLGGGAQSEVIFGAFGHVIIGDTEQIEISAHPDGSFFDGSSTVSGVSLDVTPMRAIARHDLACRYRGKEIARLDAVTWA